jgi:hypothetical protein
MELSDYAGNHYGSGNGWEIIYGMSLAEIETVIAGATSLQAAYRKARQHIRVVQGDVPPPRNPSEPGAERVIKMTTAEYQRRLAPPPDYSQGRIKCWELVVEAFGVMGVRTGKGEYDAPIMQHIKNAGYSVEKLPQKDLAPAGITPTLAVFMAAHTKGDWVVMTHGHCMAIRDGVIHDTCRSTSVKKRVIGAYRIQSTKLTPVTSCGQCPDPIVFGGHWAGGGYEDRRPCPHYRRQPAA